ncbi:hypothetical protein [Micromonospora mirobrigensis]|nr:hypothetical protein [Micromonospora mirobrigensis]
MSVDDPDPVALALRLVLVALGFGLVLIGGRVAVTRRFPVAWVRVAHLTAAQRSEPVRWGGTVALIGAGVLVQQVPSLASVPHPVGSVLFAVALLLVLGALGWWTLVRR